ncbi:hypothetical protein [Sphingomonas sp. S-NIH.Pt15_0812]|uniref:hypothetical protein n=1 Tax=Sphingomonas sp. S-NIH.Pt15_0812 TaxID=1920129 RepID=UPI000F7D5ACC|nr:hypothetical protein [Sphingomonas sp. S-NIH.Pt15_0812]RSU50553.1 hypothetical protein BRX43_08860 [Sphingomonas sp. S-NIH.Pt15_0812]
MSSYAPTDPPRSRISRLWLALVLVVIAFVGGGAAVAYLARTTSLFASKASTAAAAERGEALASHYQPAPPVGVTGAPAIDPATLVTREAALAAQLSALEARAAAVSTDAAAAGAQATRAEALMVAFAARRAIDRGAPLGYLEEQLRTRFGQAQPRAVSVVIQAARTPVTIEDLRQGLDSLAPSLAAPASDGWWQDIRRELGSLVVLRPENAPSTRPADRIARARGLLADGRVEAARAEIARLPGADAASGWMAAAHRYLLVHQALDVLETAAILGQAQGAQPQPRMMVAPQDDDAQPADGPVTSTVTS